jgi:hypothetical protein
MQRAVVYGFVLACLAAFSFLTVTPVERKILNPNGTTAPSAATKPAQVEVTNLPAVQTVSGSVNVLNLPAVQTVAGTVGVSNLPIDANGRLLVATQNLGSNALVLRSTATTYQGDLGGRTGATQKCQAEFEGSHFANESEIQVAGVNGRGIIWLSSETLPSWMDVAGFGGGGSCYSWTRLTDPNQGILIDGRALQPKAFGSSPQNCDQSLPLLCAE